MSIKRVIKQVYTALLWTFIGLGLLLTLTFLLLQTPIVKEFLAQKVVEEISRRTSHPIELGQIQVSWLDQVVASDLHLRDLQDSTMVKSERVEINFDLFGLFNGQTLFFDDIVVQGAQVHLIRYPESTSINLKEFMDRLGGKKEKDRPTQEIRIGNVELQETRFVNRNMNVPPRGDGIFDFNDLALQIDQMIVHDLSLKGQVLQAAVLSLQADHSHSPLRVEDLQTNLYLDSQHLTLANLNLETPRSHILDSVAMTFNHFGNLSDFMDSVHLDVKLRDTRLSLLDLQYFSNIPRLDTTLFVNLDASGPVSRLTFESFRIGISSGSHLEGAGIIFGLPDADATFADLQISDGLFQDEDIQRLVGQYDFRNGVAFRGDFVGFVKDFVAAAQFRTDYGSINSDINVKYINSLLNAEYTGSIELDRFDIGRVIAEPDLGMVSMVGQVEGSGLTRENVDLNLDVNVSELVYNEYAYDSLVANGRFKDHFFDGTFSIFDPHCQVGGRANIELTGQTNLQVDLDFDSLHLYELHFAKEQLDLGGTIAGEIIDLNLDEAGGQLRIENLNIRNSKGSEHMPFIEIQALRDDAKKQFSVNTPDFLAKLEGSFVPSALIKDLPAIIESYYLLLTTDRNDLQQVKMPIAHDTTVNYSWELDLELKDINPYFRLLGLPVYVSENATIEAEFSRRKNINLSFFCQADSLQLGPDAFEYNSLEVSASRDLASTDVLALIQMNSQSQYWDRTEPTSDLSLEWVWFNNTINSQLKVDQPSLNNSLVLNNEVRYLRDSINFKILPSQIVVNGNQWRFDRDNHVSWIDDYLTLHDLEVRSDEQVIYLAGQYSLDTISTLAFGVENFDLTNLAPLMRKKVEGTLSLQGNLAQLGSEDLQVEGTMLASNLTIEGLEAGDLRGETSYDSRREQLRLDLSLAREGINTIDLTGYVLPYEDYDQINIQLEFDQANIDLVQPFLTETFSEISGYVSGDVNIGGPITSPTFFGNGDITDGHIKLNYTNAAYTVNGPVAFDSYELSFRGVDIRDDVNGRGKLYGSIYHDNLTEIQVDFLFSFQNLRLLNTSSRDNDLFYGRAFGTGNLRVSGATNNLAMVGEITSVGNSRVFFPLESTGNALQEDYILFVDPRADKEEQPARPLRDAGVTVDLDLNVTPDLYAELIFDAQKGDIIRGRAQGGLQVKLNQNGELLLLGGLEIQSGAYNFTVPGINKEFEIRQGGTISWSGDPYDGSIDLEAIYRQAASLTDWDPELKNNSKIPFLVVLDLEGEMMQPDIRFRIESEDVPTSATSDVSRFLVTVNDREDELNRQVFSLLMLRKLSPQNSFQFAEVGRGISSSVSEILSNQLSYWLSQSDENLEVDIDLTGLDQEAFNTFQYRLAYSFFDGRLKISGGNTLDNPTGTDTELAASNNSLFDNWSVEYLISPDGRLRVKVFSRVNPALTGSTDVYQETGASVQYVQSFNHFKELISKPDSDLKDRATEPIPQGTPKEAKLSSDF